MRATRLGILRTTRKSWFSRSGTTGGTCRSGTSYTTAG
jgi:hypothetical protein